MKRLLAAAFTWAIAATLVLPLGTESAAVAPADPSFSATKTITRVHTSANGSDQPVFSNTVTVNVDHTTELRGRERVAVSWSGARPSGGRASDPYGEKGLAQEYPVIILQCRGVDDASAPASKQLRPETCWTSTADQRSALLPHRRAVWRHDRYESEAGRQARSGMADFPEEECQVPDESQFSARITPFVAADGDVFLGCDAEHMPPEAASESAFPPAELAAFTNADGRGKVNFEVRSEVENESLGCSYKVACSIVVIPILGTSCLDDDLECRRTGGFLPGSSNFEGTRPHDAVAPRYWWTESNWRNRVTVPIEFGLPPGVCDVLDPRPPVGFAGSELMAQAALQWAPAYCLDKKRFKFQHDDMPDQPAWGLMESGEAPAAFVSSGHERTGPDPVGFAPTAVTGFAVGYVIDRPDNAGEFDRLRLNARLLAKLLTQSYPASPLGRGHPGMAENPLSVNLDPEFQKLNPGLDQQAREAAATVLSLSIPSDVVGTLTSYISADPDAAAFIKGRPDPWGMKINPTYKGIDVPLDEWPLLDVYSPPAEPGTCRYANNDTPYLTQVAAPVSHLGIISDALVDSWPNVQTTCEGPLAGGLYKTGRVARQPYGQRFMLGLVSLGDAARFGIRTAAMQTSRKSFVQPTDTSIAKAIKLTEQHETYGPFTVAQRDLLKARTAYPGTMIVYTSARLSNLEKKQAATVASFIRIATREGQRPGRGNGELPSGYLPIRKTGVTAKLWQSAQDVADAIEAQQGIPDDTDDDEEPPDEVPGDDPPPDGTGTTPDDDVPTDETDEDAPDTDDESDDVDAAGSTYPTSAATSSAGKFLLPALVMIGLLAAASSIVSRFVRGRSNGLT